MPRQSRGGRVVRRTQNHGEPAVSGSPCGALLECMWVALKAVLR